MTEIPTLPDADLILMAIVASVEGFSENYGTQIPDDMLGRLPFAVVVRFGGASTDPRWSSRANVSIDVWDETRQGARDKAYDIWVALRDAALAQTVFSGLGHVSGFSGISEPSELRTPDQADNVWRFNASASLILRPA